jgi:hypothetical protein
MKVTGARRTGRGRSPCFGDRLGGAPGNIGFGFNARDISGFPTGAATLTGGGSYNPVTGFVKSAGGFRCTSDIGQACLPGVSLAKAFAGTRSSC